MLDLSRESVLYLRGAVPLETRARLADVQCKLRALADAALAGEDNPLATCIARRYTLNYLEADEMLGAPGRYHDLAEGIALPILRDVIGDRPFTRSMYGGIFVSHPRFPRTSDFHWHPDGHLNGFDEEVITIWIPLCDCGRDAPGLAFVRTPDEVLTIEGYCRLPIKPDTSRKVFTPVDWIGVTDADIETHFGPVEAPAFELGDVLVFNNRTIYRTYTTPEMTEARGSIIIRYTVG